MTRQTRSALALLSITAVLACSSGGGGGGGGDATAGASGDATAGAGGGDAGGGDTGSSPDAGGAGGDPDASGDAGGRTSASCYISGQRACDDWSNGTPGYIAETEVSCGNRGGVWDSPAACPTADFVGKCVVPASPDGSQLAMRYYAGTDLTAIQDFCANIAAGAWSTTF